MYVVSIVNVLTLIKLLQPTYKRISANVDSQLYDGQSQHPVLHVPEEAREVRLEVDGANGGVGGWAGEPGGVLGDVA